MRVTDPLTTDQWAEGDLSGLVDRALSDPGEWRDRIHDRLKRRRARTYPSILWQALGLAERECGDLAPAIRHLGRAVEVADAHESSERRADVRASFGATLALAGQRRRAVDVLDDAARLARGREAAQIAVRRGFVLWTLGQYGDALAAFNNCIPVLHRHGDVGFEARALLSRAVVFTETGSFRRAGEDLQRAEELFRDTRQATGAARAMHNRGWLNYRIGDLAGAIRLLDAAAEQYALASINEPWLEVDLCTVMIAAGLPGDAKVHALRAADLLTQRSMAGLPKAEVDLAIAEVSLTVGNTQQAIDHARQAQRTYRAHGRDRGHTLARLTEVRARWHSGERSARILPEAIRLVDELARLRATEVGEARLLAARIAISARKRALALDLLVRERTQRHRGSALDRVVDRLSEAIQAECLGATQRLFHAARAGLRILDEHRISLGSTELRATATANGLELVTLALRQAVQGHRAREILIWNERSRATTLALPPIRPPRDRELVVNLAKLRDVTHKVNEARIAGQSTVPLERERRRLEEAVRARTLQTPGGHGATPSTSFDVKELLESLGDRRLVSIVEIDGDLIALVAGAGRVRRFDAGRIEDVSREVDYARFALRGAAGRGETRAQVALQRADAAAPGLQEMLFGKAAGALGDGPLIVVPPAKLHALPWAVLPALRDRPFTVAPSAATWIRAKKRRPPRRRDVVLIAGPDLGSRGAEVAALEKTYHEATVLTNSAARCQEALKTLNGAWLAHIAAHGSLRSDNPLFSSLTLHDGPLTVYDIERLRTAPYRLILSACESGIGTQAGADEVLGLASAMISLGTAGLLGSTVVVDDDAAVRVSLLVHERLRAGDDLAHALHYARRETADDPVAHATALAFLPLGAA